jgi:UDP-2,4-diacetamido-2,4,6-trideoxy-beta-L-altropyranose hydrolase
MRCLTLALSLKTRGAQITFFSRNLPKALTEILSEHKIQLNSLALPKKPTSDGDLDHSTWLGLSQQEDAEILSDALGDADFDWLIVDHYALDFRWEGKLRKHRIKILAIDDLADRRHDCDILLDQNLYSDMEIRYIGLIPTEARVLLGPKYALLRDEFKFAREGINPRLGDVKTVLISFGGVDTKNFTGTVLESLEGLALGDIQVVVLLGSSHPFLSEIQKICDARGYKCSIQTD